MIYVGAGNDTIDGGGGTNVAVFQDKLSNYIITSDSKGLVITDIGANSPLDDKGAHVGDVIVEAAQKEMKDPKDLQALAKDAYGSKKPLLLLIDRGGDLRFTAVTPIDPSKASKDEPKKDDGKKEKKNDKDKDKKDE